MVLPASTPTTKELILDVARARFADHGYAGTSLNDIADEVGIRRPSLLHHFPSKDALYRAVLLDAVRRLDRARRAGDRRAHAKAGRRSSGCCAPRSRSSRSIPTSCASCAGKRSKAVRSCEGELTVLLRPLFDRGADFLEREMDAGRLRRYDARQLLLTGYGAVLSYLSDAPLMTACSTSTRCRPRRSPTGASTSSTCCAPPSRSAVSENSTVRPSTPERSVVGLPPLAGRDAWASVSVPVVITSPAAGAENCGWAATVRARKPSASAGLPRTLSPLPRSTTVPPRQREIERHRACPRRTHDSRR